MSYSSKDPGSRSDSVPTEYGPGRAPVDSLAAVQADQTGPQGASPGLASSGAAQADSVLQGGESRRVRRWPGVIAIGLAAVLMIGAVGVAGRSLFRAPTKGEKHDAAIKLVANHWRTMTAATMFPASVTATAPDADPKDADLLHRIGVEAPSSCSAALDNVVAWALIRHRCSHVFRADYASASGGQILTVAVAVIGDTDTTAVDTDLDTSGVVASGARALALPNTVSADFKDASRQGYGQASAIGYEVFSTWGFADGRPQARTAVEDPSYTADSLAQAIAGEFRMPNEVCKAKGVQC